MAKLSDDMLRFIIDLDASGAQGKINTLTANIAQLEKENQSLNKVLSANEKELKQLSSEMQRLEKAGKTNTAQYKRLQQQYQATRQNSQQFRAELEQNTARLQQNRQNVQQLTQSLSLNQMTMNQLRERARQLRQQLEMTSKATNPEQFRKLRNELEKTERQMHNLDTKTKQTRNVFAMFLGNIYSSAIQKGFQLFTSAIRSAVNVITDFEQQNANLASVLGTSQKEVKQLTDDAKRLGASTQYTASEITLLQTELAKLGFTTREILQSTEAIQAFATATGASLPEAAQLAGAALRAFGLDASEMERVVSTMAVATTKSALNFNYLQTALSTVAPVAKSLGFSIEETTALLGTLANSGFDASTAATATRNILLNLADTSGKLAKRLGEPVKNLDQLVPALKKLQLQGVDLAEALELTDKRSVAAFSTFLSGTDTLANLREEITGVNEELRVMQQERLDTVQGSVTLLKSAWDGLLLSFYNSKGAMKVAVDALTGLVNKLNEVINPKPQTSAWLTQQEDRIKQLEEMQKMTFEQAKQFDEKLTHNEREMYKSWERNYEDAKKRGDKEREDFYYNEMAALAVFREDRQNLLKQMEADDEQRQQKRNAEETAERKKKQKEQQQAAKDAAEEARKQRDKEFKEELAEEKEYTTLQLTQLKEQYANREITEQEFTQRTFMVQMEHLERLKALQQQYGQSTIDTENQIQDLRLQINKNIDQAIEAARRKNVQKLKKLTDETINALSTAAKIAQQTSHALGDTLGGELMQQFATATEGIQKMFDVLKKEGATTAEKTAATFNGIAGAVSAAMNAAADITKKAFELETASLEAEKQKQLSIAGENAEMREAIEQEYAQKELDLKKKQADADAGVKTAQLWVNTAMGVANAWAQLGPIPFVGPILAGAMTAALLATAGVEQAAIIKQRDAIKATTLDTSSRSGSAASVSAGTAKTSTNNTYTLKKEYAAAGYAQGGYTGDGSVTEPAGIVHKGEYVVPQAELHNPVVVPMVRRIEAIRTQRLGGLRTMAGFADGGYTSAGNSGQDTLQELRQSIELLTQLLSKPIHAEVNYREFESARRKIENIHSIARK